MIEIKCVIDAKAQLGESPYWDPCGGVLWWVDIFGRLIRRYDPINATEEVFDTPEQLGCLSVRKRGGLVVTMKSGFHFFDPGSRTFEHIVDPEDHLPDTRFNDGKTDRQGRFWSGTVFEAAGKESQSIGGLYRLDTDLSCHCVLKNVGCANGLAWSPDNRIMYFSDSRTPIVWAYEFDEKSGTTGGRQEFINLSAMNAFIDGSTVDSEGCYWTTLPHRSLVARYDPDGRLIQAIELPTDMPTSCEFGGPDLDVLYVTTAIYNRTPEELSKQPQAGGLFALNVCVRGLPSQAFAG
jgi:sugar lactone lactonase YvrE